MFEKCSEKEMRFASESAFLIELGSIKKIRCPTDSVTMKQSACYLLKGSQIQMLTVFVFGSESQNSCMSVFDLESSKH